MHSETPPRTEDRERKGMGWKDEGKRQTDRPFGGIASGLIKHIHIPAHVILNRACLMLWLLKGKCWCTAKSVVQNKCTMLSLNYLQSSEPNTSGSAKPNPMHFSAASLKELV